VSVHALIPLKHHGEPKSRLATLLSAEERIALMESSTAEVVAAVAAVPAVVAITVVSSGRGKEKLAADLGASFFDDRGLAWNEALRAASEQAVSQPLVLVVSADIPLVRAAELERLIVATPGRGIAIARSLDAGTNAVALRPPAAFTTCFGASGSALLHAELARRAGLEAAILDQPGTALDLDSPEDVERFLAAAGAPSPTRRLLERVLAAGRSGAAR
jgi:2-phospho-L-lactate guanylyltransferase